MRLIISRKDFVALLGVAAVLVTNTAAYASEQKKPKVDVSIAIWESTGGTVWTHDASAFEPLVGNPTSRLEYDGVDSTIVELRARAELRRGWSAELAYGAGDAKDGQLIDQDFLSATGAISFGSSMQGEHLYSETVSGLDGDAIRYFDAKVVKELLHSANGKTKAGASLRYLNWKEKYRVRGVRQTVCTVPNLLCFPQGFSGFDNQDAVLNDARWQAVLFGVWGTHRIGERIALSGELFYSPLADLSSDDRHFLRPDLGQSPSFRLTGIGQAATLQIDAAYAVTSRLSASVGFRYWWMEVSNEDGGFAVFPAGTDPLGATLKQFESERYGVVLNIVYAFGVQD